MNLLLKRRSGWTWEAVQRELESTSREYEKLDPATFGKQQLNVTPLREHVVGDTRPMLLLLWSAVSCLLLVSCANAANIVLSRTTARARELAVRSSLGASSARLFSQLIVESSLMAAIAATIGILLAASTIPVARHALGDFLPRVDAASTPCCAPISASAPTRSSRSSSRFPKAPCQGPKCRRCMRDSRRGSRSGHA
jgi:putative ABC transport system permease protein